MLAILALVAFVVGLVVLGTVHSWAFWLLLGLVFLAADNIYTGLGYTYPGRRR